MPEKRLLSFFQRQYFYCTFQYTYTECCFGDCLEYIDRCLFPAKEKYIYVVLGLGSTDDVLLTSICLRKPHLEHKKKRSCLPHMQEIYIYICFFRLRFYGPCFLICTHLLGETTLRTYVKPSYLPHMPEKRSISFRSSKDSTSIIARSSIHIRSVVSGIVWSILIGIYSQQKKNIYVVLGLGSTDDVLLTSICLRKPHLEHKQKHSCLPQMHETRYSPFDFPKTCTSISGSSKHIQRVVFRGLSVRCW